jgi:hypothetical protein
MQRRCNVDRECCEQCFRASSHITHARLDMAADLLLLPFTPLPVLTPPWLYTSKAVLQSRETPSAGIWNLEGQRRAREGGKSTCPVQLCPRLHGPLTTTVAHSCQLFQPSREKRVRLVKRTVVGALGDVRHTVRVSRREKKGRQGGATGHL